MLRSIQNEDLEDWEMQNQVYVSSEEYSGIDLDEPDPEDNIHLLKGAKKAKTERSK